MCIRDSIFGMTTPWRLPILYPMQGIIGSIDSILPEHLRYNPHTGVDEEMLNKTIKKMIVKDLFHTLDIQALEKMMNWKKLIPNSTVIWGTIHFQHSLPNGGVNKDGILTEKERIKRLHQHLINSNQSSVDLFFFSKKIFNLYLKSKVLNKSSPGDLIKSISSSRFGYGGPEITSTLWPKFFKALDNSNTNIPWPPPNGALR